MKAGIEVSGRLLVSGDCTISVSLHEAIDDKHKVSVGQQNLQLQKRAGQQNCQEWKHTRI